MLSKHYNFNLETVRKWCARHSVEEAPVEISYPYSPSIAFSQEAVAVAFRKKTLLALDDCLHALQQAIPCLTCSSLHHHCQADSSICSKETFKCYPEGYLHIGIIE